jgi:uncharacterized phage-associated protein
MLAGVLTSLNGSTCVRRLGLVLLPDLTPDPFADTLELGSLSREPLPKRIIDGVTQRNTPQRRKHPDPLPDFGVDINACLHRVRFILFTVFQSIPQRVRGASGGINAAPRVLLSYQIGTTMNHRVRINFEFQPEKLVQALAFFAHRGIADLTKLKAAKLLFLADKYHLLKYGRPITGDQYFCMDFGPVPSESLDMISRFVAPDEVADRTREQLGAFLEREEHQHPLIRARRPPDLDVFSDSDIEALEHTVRRFGRLTAGQLIDLVHKDPGVKRADKGRPPGRRSELPYEFFFEGQPEAVKTVLEVIEAEQECRDAAEELTRPRRPERIRA